MSINDERGQLYHLFTLTLPLCTLCRLVALLQDYRSIHALTEHIEQLSAMGTYEESQYASALVDCRDSLFTQPPQQQFFVPPIDCHFDMPSAHDYQNMFFLFRNDYAQVADAASYDQVRSAEEDHHHRTAAAEACELYSHLSPDVRSLLEAVDDEMEQVGIDRSIEPHLDSRLPLTLYSIISIHR